MKQIILALLLLNSTFTLASDSFWSCKGSVDSSVSRNENGDVEKKSGKASGNSTHIFKGLGGQIAQLSFAKDKPDSKPDMLVQLPTAKNTYFAGGEEVLVLWSFQETSKTKTAIKTLRIMRNGVSAAVTTLFKCI